MGLFKLTENLYCINQHVALPTNRLLSIKQTSEFWILHMRMVWTPNCDHPKLKVRTTNIHTGRWIADLQKAASPAEHDYIGTDVVESLYPKPPPKRTHFQDQSIKEPFTAGWQGFIQCCPSKTRHGSSRTRANSWICSPEFGRIVETRTLATAGRGDHNTCSWKPCLTESVY